MLHPLEEQLVQLRRRGRRLLGLYAAGWIAALVVGVILLLGLADFVIRYRDQGVRVICSLALLGTVVWACFRFGYQTLARKWDDVELARRVERRFPALADRLATSMEFLKQPESDPRAGSAELRRAVILDTASRAEQCNFADALETGPTRRALGAAGMAALAALLLVAAAPANCWIALSRLINPLGDDVFPRFYRVEFIDPPSRLAAGQNFEVELKSDAEHRVPDQVRIYYRFETPGGSVEHDSELMGRIGGTMVARRENVSRPFSYRAEGGDDATPWTKLEVVEAPRIESLEIKLHPPAYSGLPMETSEKTIQALRGTKIALGGSSTKRLRSMQVRRESGPDVSVTISSDGYQFTLLADSTTPWVAESSGPYWLVLEDNEGLVGGERDRWDLRVLPDRPPVVAIDQPAGNIFVTSAGEVPITITARDDLAIRDAALVYTRSDRTDEESFRVPLFEGAADPPQRESMTVLASGRMSDNLTLEHRWKLSELNLPPKARLTFWATAGDYLPQSGKSLQRQITIITPQELDERLAQRQTLIVTEFQRILKLQQDSHNKTESLEVQMSEMGKLTPEDIDRAQAAELVQRQVGRNMTSATEGVQPLVKDFLADLDNNKLDSPDLARHMTSILNELDRLGRDHLTPAERKLTTAIKAAQGAQARERRSEKPDDGTRKQIDEALKQADDDQKNVIASLESMLGELRQWDSFRRFSRDVAQLQRDQEEVAKAASQLNAQTQNKSLQNLEGQQRADLKKLAGAQLELSLRLEKIQQQMSDTAQALRESDPLAAGTLDDGVHQAVQDKISSQMRTASGQIERHQLGVAMPQQAAIAKELEELAGILSNRKEQELSRLVKQLREAEKELADMRARQAQLRKQMAEAAKAANAQERARQLERLAREERKLQEEAARIARKLERLQSQQAASAAGNAAADMSRSADAGQQGDAGGAEEKAQQAERDLEEAERQVAERRKQAEADLAREQVAKTQDAIKALEERQGKLIEETKRLEGLRGADGRLSRAQQSTLADVARQQASLGGEVDLLGQKLALAEALNLGLGGAAKQMSRAADLLGEQQTGPSTQRAEESARARLAGLLKAFERNNKPGEEKEGGGGGEAGSGSEEEGDGDFMLTQLKVLRVLQEDINDRYRELVTLGESGDASAKRATAKELSEMAAEQGRLAELTLKLSQPKGERPEDAPESLPDIRKSAPQPPADKPAGSLERELLE